LFNINSVKAIHSLIELTSEFGEAAQLFELLAGGRAWIKLREQDFVRV